MIPLLEGAWSQRGYLVDEHDCDADSKLLTDAAILFAMPVFRTVAGDRLCSGAGAAGQFLGFSIATIDLPPTNPPGSYVQGDTVGVLRRGVMWVWVLTPTTPGALAYYDAAGNLSVLPTNNTAVPNGIFETSAKAGGGLAQLRLQ